MQYRGNEPVNQKNRENIMTQTQRQNDRIQNSDNSKRPIAKLEKGNRKPEEEVVR